VAGWREKIRKRAKHGKREPEIGFPYGKHCVLTVISGAERGKRRFRFLPNLFMMFGTLFPKRIQKRFYLGVQLQRIPDDLQRFGPGGMVLRSEEPVPFAVDEPCLRRRYDHIRCI